ncbi:MAG: NAD(P)-dependent oxidoreductase [Rhodospirillales bacterium]
MSGVLVTGATSYLGGKLVERLTANGTTVHAAVRAESDTMRLTALANPPVLHVLDGATESLCHMLSETEPDSVCHLASLYRREHEAADIGPMIDAVVGFGTQVLEAMRRAGTRRLVTLGSYFQFLDSEEPRAVNLYAAAKNAFDAILDYYEDALGIEATRLVLFEVYGEDDPRRKLMSVVRDAALGGTAVPLPARDMPLDLVHVDDAAEAIVHALDAGVTGGPYAIRSGEVMTVDTVVSAFEAETGTAIARDRGAFTLPERHPSTLWDGPALPGWQARVKLKHGVRRMLSAGDRG